MSHAPASPSFLSPCFLKAGVKRRRRRVLVHETAPRLPRRAASAPGPKAPDCDRREMPISSTFL